MNILQRATDDIKHLLEMGSPVFTIDADGFLLKEGTRYLASTGPNSTGKELLVLKDPLPDGDFFLINPYGEGAGIHSTPLNLFYRILLMGMVQSLICCTTNILIYLVKASKKETDKVPAEVLKVAAFNKIGDDALADSVDARMIKEFEKIDAVVAPKIHLIYPPKKMRVQFHIEGFDVESLKTALGKGVREKTIRVYIAILLGILGCHTVEELDKFTTVYDPDVNAPPKMWCYLNSLLKVYMVMSAVLDDVGLFPEKMDLTELKTIVDRIPDVFKTSRHVIQAEYGQDKPAAPRRDITKPSAMQAPDTGKVSFREKMFGAPSPMTPPVSGRAFAEDVRTQNTNSGFKINRFDTSRDYSGFSSGRSFSGNTFSNDGFEGRTFGGSVEAPNRYRF